MGRSERSQNLFESDRRVELKIRLALKKAAESPRRPQSPIHLDRPPEPELVGKLIAKVRSL